MKISPLDKSELKKLKKYQNELNNYFKIIELMVVCSNYESFVTNPILKAYSFEKLKHQMTGYYSIRLSKRKAGVIRLLFKININQNIIDLIYISMDHYKDFSRSEKFKESKREEND